MATPHTPSHQTARRKILQKIHRVAQNLHAPPENPRRREAPPLHDAPEVLLEAPLRAPGQDPTRLRTERGIQAHVPRRGCGRIGLQALEGIQLLHQEP